MKLDFLQRIDFIFVAVFVFLSVLSFAGMSVLVIGLVMREWILIVPGILIAFFVHRPLFGLKPLAVLLGAVVVGTLFGVFLGNLTTVVFGVIAGTLWGAFLGFGISIVLFAFLVPGLPLGPVKVVVLPKNPTFAFVIAGICGLVMIAGGVWGFIHLHESIANPYGPLGSGIMLGWSIGAIIAYRLKHNSPMTI